MNTTITATHPLIKGAQRSLLLHSLSQLQQLQRPIMKFVALTLAVLLAAGTHARVLQADAPSQLDHVKSVVELYLNQVKESVDKALVHLDDTEYKDYKQYLTQGLDKVHDLITKSTDTVAPYGQQLAVMTEDIRTKIMNDVEGLRTQLQPQREELRQVIQKHLEEYREKLTPVLKEYTEKHRQEMDGLRAKLQPVVEELREKVATNVEETKSKLMPIVEAVRAKVNERLEELKVMVAPLAQEYREHLTKTLAGLKDGNQDLQDKLKPLAEEVKEKLAAMWNIIKEHMQP